jgi:hypothetical protein
MVYAIVLLLCLALLGAALFFFLRSGELSARLRASEEAWKAKEERYTSELARLEKIRHIPDIIEKARRVNADVEAKLADAERRADEILQRAVGEGQEQSRKLRAEAETLKSEAHEALRIAKAQAQKAIEEAQNEAKEQASTARKETKERREKAEIALTQAIAYALEIRQKAERRAEEIAGEAYEAKGRVRDYEAMAQALKNRIEKYKGGQIVPPSHIGPQIQ